MRNHWPDFLLAMLVVAILLAVGILFQGSTSRPDVTHEYIPAKTAPCRWDDLCNGVVSPARIQAHKKETP